MDEWKNTVEDVESLINDGYTIKIAGIKGKEGWWAIKTVPYKTTQSYRIDDKVINEMINRGYTTKETIRSYVLIKP